jgi:hypothetical protein
MGVRTGPTARRALIAALALLTTAFAAGPASAQVHMGQAGGCIARFTTLRWEPSRVDPGDHTQLVVKARNCTDRQVLVTEIEFGEQIPPCPTLDPISNQGTMPPHGRVAFPPLRMIAPSCHGVEVEVVRLSNPQGRTMARGTATLHIGG